jgi:hypothetical protein
MARLKFTPPATVPRLPVRTAQLSGKTTETLVSFAALDDGAMLRSFLAPLPHAATFRRLLSTGRPGHWRAYRQETREMHFLTTDGPLAQCVTLTNVSRNVAALITAQIERDRGFRFATLRGARS